MKGTVATAYHNILRLSKYLDKSEADRYDIQQNEKGVEEEEYIITSARESCPGLPRLEGGFGKGRRQSRISRVVCVKRPQRYVRERMLYIMRTYI